MHAAFTHQIYPTPQTLYLALTICYKHMRAGATSNGKTAKALSDCYCPAGYAGDPAAGDPCKICDFGFWAAVRAATCTECPANSYAWPGESAPTRVDKNMPKKLCARSHASPWRGCKFGSFSSLFSGFSVILALCCSAVMGTKNHPCVTKTGRARYE